MKIDFLTLFPEALEPSLQSSLLGKAQETGLARFRFIQIRNFSTDKHRTVDDSPYGGGEGMVMRADVLKAAWDSVATPEVVDGKTERVRTLFLSPQGPLLTQEKAKELGRDYDRLILVCGHYEGIDERFIEACVDEELSIGDYILTGGELAALVLTDAVVRVLPGVVGNPDSISKESLEDGLLKYPQYTKPREFSGRTVPEVLLSGNHAAIKNWRDQESLNRTRSKRPDLFSKLSKTRKS